MKIRHSYIENSNFSFASMTDVITTLLIFLMLIVSVDNLHHNDKEVKIDLPVSKSAVNCDSENVAVVVIDKNSNIYVDNKSIRYEELAKFLRGIKSAIRHVVLKVDRNVKIQRIVDVLDITTGLKISTSLAAFNSSKDREL